jgi:regulator of RNase E activity RraA
MRFNNPEDIIALTPEWKGERFPDGRPRVPDRYLEALKSLTLEELWKPIFVQGYESQFVAMKSLYSEFDANGNVNKKLIGRAVTAVYAPKRPDYFQAMMDSAAAKGWSGTPNQWVIESLTEGDVLVVDMFDKIYKGTFLGGNLTTALRNKTKTGGAVVWGGVRDVEQMKKVEGVQVYFRGIDPTPIRDFVMIGYNTPTRIGNAICMPGDVVFGAGGGVLFIPAHLVAEVVDGAVKTQVKDLFGFEMISQNKFTTAQIDKNTWTKEMLDLLMEFIKTDDRAADYRDLDWSEEYYLAEHGDPTDTQSAL